MGTSLVDYTDSFITGSVVGSAKQKTNCTNGLGARLVNETPVDIAHPQQPRLAKEIS